MTTVELACNSMAMHIVMEILFSLLWALYKKVRSQFHKNIYKNDKRKILLIKKLSINHGPDTCLVLSWFCSFNIFIPISRTRLKDWLIDTTKLIYKIENVISLFWRFEGASLTSLLIKLSIKYFLVKKCL